MIDVYFLDVNVPGAAIEALTARLTAAERAHADSYRFEEDRRRSIVARAATRHLLGRYLDADPLELEIVEEEHGKPVLRGRPIEFNASHSGSLIALAFSRNSPVGVDVEERRTLHDPLGLAQRYFSPAEVAMVKAADDIDAAFLAIWTAKEAIVKATGKGIGAGDLRGFSVPFAQPRMLPVLDRWCVASIIPPLTDYFAAVSCATEDAAVQTQTVDIAYLL